MTRPQCYGTMFPDFDARKLNTPARGCVFSTLVKSAGAGIQGRCSTVNREKWDGCTECDHYRTCYDLSVAQLLVSMANGQTFI